MLNGIRTSVVVTVTSAVALMMSAGMAVAGPYEVSSCEQEGSSLSGSCIDGTQFELTCTDGANAIECDLDEQTAWDICGEQCEESGDDFSEIRPSRGIESVGIDIGRRGVRNRAKAKTKAKSKVISKRSRTNPGRVVARGEIDLPSRYGPLVREKTRSYGPTLRGMTSGLLCVADGHCTIEVNGKRVRREAVSTRTAQLALGANQLLAGLNWEEDIPQDWLDVVCAISLGLAFNPPIGTALGGPTALGCLVMMAMDEI